MSEAIPLGMISAFHARRDPRRPMLTYADRTMTRGEFDARANRRARMLAAAGVGKGDLITLMLPNGFEFNETCFALWKIGATPQPVSALLPDNELRAIVDLVQPKLVIGADAGRVPGHRTIAAGSSLDKSLSADPLSACESDYFRAVTSGGSTGRPKIIVNHGGTRIDPLRSVSGFQVDGIQLNPGPLYHSGPFSYVAAGLFLGAHVIDGGKFDAANTLRLIEKYRVDWLYMVPTMMHRIWRLPTEVRESIDVSSLRTVWHMAAPCPQWLKQAWIDWLGPETIHELYACAESQGGTVLNGVEWLAHRGSVGRVIPGTRLAILDDQGNPCPPGEVGEVFFLPDAGRGSTYHYIGAEAKAVGEWETPGDLGYVDEDDYLYIVDRRVDMVISGGANVYPAEIEAAIEAHADVECAVVIGLPDEDLGQKVHALVQLKDSAQELVTADVLRAHLANQLVRYKIPRSFEFVGQPLRDAAGKVRRSALRDERVKALETQSGSVAASP